jgi:hypothetical protein
MTKSLRRERGQGKANRIRSQSGKQDGLSPSLENELHDGMEQLRDVRKAEGAAADIGVSRSVYYERQADPLDLRVRELIALLVKSEARNPGFGSRVIGHLSALTAQSALAASEARHTYDRIQSHQRALFGGER